MPICVPDVSVLASRPSQQQAVKQCAQADYTHSSLHITHAHGSRPISADLLKCACAGVSVCGMYGCRLLSYVAHVTRHHSGASSSAPHDRTAVSRPLPQPQRPTPTRHPTVRPPACPCATTSTSRMQLALSHGKQVAVPFCQAAAPARFAPGAAASSSAYRRAALWSPVAVRACAQHSLRLFEQDSPAATVCAVHRRAVCIGCARALP
jgi:hypothetical protein